MGNQPTILIPRIENNPIRTWTAARIDLKSPQDRILIIRARDGEIEAFVVVVDVWVRVDVVGGGVEGVRFGLGRGYGAGVVADCAAGV